MKLSGVLNVTRKAPSTMTRKGYMNLRFVVNAAVKKRLAMMIISEAGPDLPNSQK